MTTITFGMFHLRPRVYPAVYPFVNTEDTEAIADLLARSIEPRTPRVSRVPGVRGEFSFACLINPG